MGRSCVVTWRRDGTKTFTSSLVQCHFLCVLTRSTQILCPCIIKFRSPSIMPDGGMSCLVFSGSNPTLCTCFFPSQISWRYKTYENIVLDLFSGNSVLNNLPFWKELTRSMSPLTFKILLQVRLPPHLHFNSSSLVFIDFLKCLLLGHSIVSWSLS
jgi:hypothetical protein